MDVRENNIDMNQVAGNHHILFVCLDSLRYDVAKSQEEEGLTPVLSRYGAWCRCHAPGNFTYPSHQAMFAGFFPVDTEVRNMKQRQTLFFSEDVGMGRKAPKGAFVFQGATFIEGLAAVGYETYCIGGLSFFDKRTDIGKVMPGYFQHSYWNPSFGCRVRESTAHQVDFACRKLEEIPPGQKIMMYVNVSALHYPTDFYVPGGVKGYQGMPDTIESQAAALRYVDGELGRLFEAFARKGKTFVICCSDHGTCFGEDGCQYHGFNHDLINVVPYKHFFLEACT